MRASNTTAAASPEPAAQELHALFQSDWDYRMEQWPTWASALGDRRWNDRWPDMRPEAFESRDRHARQVLEQLAGIDPSELPPGDALNHDLFRREHLESVAEHAFGWYRIPLNQREGIQTADELAESLRFETVQDYDDWLGRLQAFPAYVDQTIALMREGVRARMLLPRVVMQRIPAQIDKQLVNDPSTSPFFKPFHRFPGPIHEAGRQRLSAAAAEAIRERILPAFARFLEFFERDYLPACPEEVGIWSLPQGEELYALFVRHYTTTPMTSSEVHETGLEEVRRIRGEMQAIMEGVGFRGTLHDFFGFLRSDSRFFFERTEDLLSAYRAMAKQIDPLLVRVFRTLPRTPYGVEPIPDLVAPDTTTAYYSPPAADGSRAGTYYVNLYRPEARPKWEMMALSLHEAVPGHHLQIALAMEQGEVPNFRRFGGYTAFVEGWALYAESLGDELGLYEDPYSKFGQLTYEMWRAVRLVVDTGIHALRWDRPRAIQYFMENAPKAELDIVNEIDRYIAWPGQSLAYKIGELKIQDLRRRASGALRERFHLREFHEVLLRLGAVPLDILERHVDAWLAGPDSPQRRRDSERIQEAPGAIS